MVEWQRTMMMLFVFALTFTIHVVRFDRQSESFAAWLIA